MTDELGLLVKLVITPGQAHDIQAAQDLISIMTKGQPLLADKAYDADWLRQSLADKDAWANVPSKSNRKEKLIFSPWLYKKRNLIERFFNKLKYFIWIDTRYDKFGATFLAMIKLACIRIRLRHYESTA